MEDKKVDSDKLNIVREIILPHPYAVTEEEKEENERILEEMRIKGEKLGIIF